MGIILYPAVLWTLATCAAPGEGPQDAQQPIRIYEANPRYWEYGGEPVLLLGGSVEDNLFQIPELEAHLDLLSSVGGNYVRCTMSARDEGNVWQFRKEGPLYNLNHWNDEYWHRFERFLQWTHEREIIAQIEVWATFDYYQDRWDRNPFNPKNNTTYDAAESGLPEVVKSHPLGLENDFFWSVPAERDQTIVLEYQRRFVDKMLSYSLRFGNVLYCMDNETAVTPEWGKYWSEYIKGKAREAGAEAQTTEMWDPWDLAHAKHNATFNHPETYSFVDISQNNHQKGQAHWDNAQRQRQRIADRPRPLNNVKIYGGPNNVFGGERDGVERFWRNIFGGLASARFHRPPHGLGLSEKAQASIRSMRMVTDRMDFFTCQPGNDLLSDREPNEAYCVAFPGREYAVYFPDGGKVTLDTSGMQGAATTRWLNIMESTWQGPEPAAAGGPLQLTCPGQGHWAALVQAE